MNDTPTLPRNVHLLEQHMQPPRHWRNQWEVAIPAGHTLEDVLRPEYWAHTYRRLRPGDLLDVVSADNQVDALLRVISVQPRAVYLRVLRAWDAAGGEAHDAPPIDPENNFPKVGWNGPAHKYAVFGLDGAVVSHGHETRDLATQEMRKMFPDRRAA